MNFIWKTTPYGKIKLSGKGLYDFTLNILSSRFDIHHVSLAPPKNKARDCANLTVIISSDDVKPEIKKRVENHLTIILKPMGIIASVIWAEPCRGFLPVLSRRWTWFFTASSVAIIITGGFRVFFWSAFWGSAAWFIHKAIEILGNLSERKHYETEIYTQTEIQKQTPGA